MSMYLPLSGHISREDFSHLHGNQRPDRRLLIVKKNNQVEGFVSAFNNLFSK